MKIALIGYGKMGHAIERLAINRGHSIVARIDMGDEEAFASDPFTTADAAIEFSTPATALDNCLKALKAGVPVVSGTTGWTGSIPEVKALSELSGVPFMWSSNYSVGVNIFMDINRRLAALMSRFDQYHPAMTEVHHIHKLDHPSGTAITLAEGIIAGNSNIGSWTEDPAEANNPHSLLISHERRGEVPGIHSITWESPVDSITITHDAKSRDGFALGAIIAAEWIVGRRGPQSFTDCLGL